MPFKTSVHLCISKGINCIKKDILMAIFDITETSLCNGRLPPHMLILAKNVASVPITKQECVLLLSSEKSEKTHLHTDLKVRC